MSGPWPPAPAIVIATGGALSREAGFAPFDPATMPPGLRLEDVVTREGFARAPDAVRGFYNRRRREMLACRPGLAHEALSALETASPGGVAIVTRNLDDLHERAGSRAVLHTHGELLKARCDICTQLSELHDEIGAATPCPLCGNEGHLRPHLVRVGEAPLHLDTAFAALSQCRRFLAVGMPGSGEPMASFVAEARRAGARCIAFAPEPDAAPLGFDESHVGPLGETVPPWVRHAIAGN